MKRTALIEHLERQGCALLREDSRHSVFLNPTNNRTSTVPHHVEIENTLARKICRDLDVPEP